jgi:hypothetical protein
LLFGGAWVAGLWRLSRVGVYVGSGGLRYIGPLRTVTVPWSQVRGVRLGPLRPFGAPHFVTSYATAIWIDRSGGDPVQTMLNDKGANFLLGGRGAFQQAYEAILSEVERRQGSG